MRELKGPWVTVLVSFLGPGAVLGALWGGLGALWSALGALKGQKRGSWEPLGSILATMVQQDWILAPKRVSMGPPRLPKWSQNGTKIDPKTVSKSMRFLSRFLSTFGCILAPKMTYFERFFDSKVGLFLKVEILSKYCTGHTDSRLGSP